MTIVTGFTENNRNFMILNDNNALFYDFWTHQITLSSFQAINSTSYRSYMIETATAQYNFLVLFSIMVISSIPHFQVVNGLK